MGDNDPWFVKLDYPIQDIRVVDELREVTIKENATAQTERYDCPLEIFGGFGRGEPELYHLWYPNAVFEHDPLVSTLLMGQTKTVTPVWKKETGVKAGSVQIKQVNRHSATRFYFVERVTLANGKTQVNPIKTITVMPSKTREQHYIYPGMPIRVNASVLGPENFVIRGNTFVPVPVKGVFFHWVQTLRPDPGAMEAGLRLLNAALSELVVLARSKGSLLRALGDAQRPVKGDLGDILSVLLLGGNYNIDGSVTVDASDYANGAPLSARFVAPKYTSWPQVKRRILNGMTAIFDSVEDAGEALVNDLFTAVLKQYTANTAVRIVAEDTGANIFMVGKVSATSVGTLQCFAVDQANPHATELKKRIPGLPDKRYRVYRELASFRIHVVGGSRTDDGEAGTFVSYVKVDPAEDFDPAYLFKPAVGSEKFLKGSLNSEVFWHVKYIKDLKAPTDEENDRDYVNYAILNPLTNLSCQDDIKATGIAYDRTASVHLPVEIKSKSLFDFARTINGGDMNQRVTFLLLAYLQESKDPIGLTDLRPTDSIGYKMSDRPGDINAALDESVAGNKSLDADTRFLGWRSAGSVARPLIGAFVVEIGIQPPRVTEERPLSMYTRNAIAFVNTRREIFREKIQDILLYRVDAARYAAEVVVGVAGNGLKIGELLSSLPQLGKRFSGLANTRLVPIAGAAVPTLVWDKSKRAPVIPDMGEALGLLNSADDVTKSKAFEWLSKCLRAYSDGFEQARLHVYQEPEAVYNAFLQDKDNVPILVALYDEYIVRLEEEKKLAKASDFRTSATAYGFDVDAISLSDIVYLFINSELAAGETNLSLSFRKSIGLEMKERLKKLETLLEKFTYTYIRLGTAPAKVIKESIQDILSRSGTFILADVEKQFLASFFAVSAPPEGLVLNNSKLSLRPPPPSVIRKPAPKSAPVLAPASKPTPVFITNLGASVPAPPTPASVSAAASAVAASSAAASAPAFTPPPSSKASASGTHVPAPIIINTPPSVGAKTTNAPVSSKPIITPPPKQTGAASLQTALDPKDYDILDAENRKAAVRINKLTGDTATKSKLEKGAADLLSTVVSGNFSNYITSAVEFADISNQETINKATTPITFNDTNGRKITVPSLVASAFAIFLLRRGSGARTDLAAEFDTLMTKLTSDIETTEAVLHKDSSKVVKGEIGSAILKLITDRNDRFDNVNSGAPGYKRFVEDIRIPLQLGVTRGTDSDAKLRALIRRASQAMRSFAPSSIQAAALASAFNNLLENLDAALIANTNVQKQIGALVADIANKTTDAFFLAPVYYGPVNLVKDMARNLSLQGTSRKSDVDNLTALAEKIANDANTFEIETNNLISQISALPKATAPQAPTPKGPVVPDPFEALNKRVNAHITFIKQKLGVANFSDGDVQESEALYYRTQSAEAADIYLRDAWRQPKIRALITSQMRTTRPVAAASQKELVADSVIMSLATLAPSDQSVPDFVSLLIEQLKASFKMVTEAEKWRYSNYDATLREAYEAIEKQTSDYVTKCRGILNEVTEELVTATLDSITKPKIALDYENPPEFYSKTLLPSNVVFWQSAKAKAKDLWDFYINMLGSITNTGQVSSFLWERVPANLQATKSTLRAFHTGATALEDVMLWKTNKIEGIKTAIDRNAPNDLHAQAISARVVKLLDMMKNHDTIELHKLADMVISGGFISIDRYVQNLNNRFKETPAMTRSIFALFCRAFLFAVLQATKGSLKALEVPAGLTSSPEQFVRVAISEWLEAYIVEHLSSPSPKTLDLFGKIKAGVDPQSERLVTAEYLKARSAEFIASLNANVDAAYKSSTFEKELVNAGAQGLIDTLYKGDFSAMSHGLSSYTEAFCMDHFYRGISKSIKSNSPQTNSMSLEFFSAALEALGILVFNPEMSSVLEASENPLFVGKNWPSSAIGSCDRFAIMSSGRWDTYKASDPMVVLGAYKASAGTSILLPSSSLPAVAADFFEARFTRNIQQTNVISELAQRKLERGRHNLQVLMGDIQAAANALKASMRTKKPAPEFSQIIIEAVQTVVDAFELELQGLRTVTTGVTLVTDADVYISNWVRETEEAKARFPGILAEVEKTVLDYITKAEATLSPPQGPPASGVAPPSVAPPSPSIVGANTTDRRSRRTRR